MDPIDDGTIFLSYASPDRERVLPVFDFLSEQGFDVWMDVKKLLPGQQWDFEIKRAFKRAKIILIFLSKESVDRRGYVQRELKLSLKYLEEKVFDDIYVIPVKLDSDVEVPDELSSIHWIYLGEANSLTTIARAILMQFERLGLHRKEVQRTEDISISSRTLKEEWEGLPGYEVEIGVPLLHSNRYPKIAEITTIIEGRFLEVLQSHRRSKLDQSSDCFSWTQDKFVRTNTLDATFSHALRGNVLSLTYHVDWYGAGAAHPNHNFEAYNFLLEPLLRISELKEVFIEPDTAFETVVEHIRNELRKLQYEDGEPLLDETWILEGTSNWESLAAHAFEEDSIAFFFAPYQVGPYACGSQLAKIPYESIRSLMTVDIRRALNLNAWD